MRYTQKALVELHVKLCDEARGVMMARNMDYTGKSGDPFANLRKHGRKGIVVRLDDKLARLDTAAEGGTMRSGTVRDTVIDIINYAILYEAMRLEEGGDAGTQRSSAV